MIRTTLMAASTALGLMATSAFADPFQTSTNRCEAMHGNGIVCTGEYHRETAELMPTVGHWVTDMNVTIDYLRQINEWGEDVDVSTEIPVGSRFAIAG